MRPIDPARLIQSVGRRIGELRRERGLTQQDVANRLQVTMRYVQRIEAGQANLTLVSLAEVANALRAPVEALFTAPQPLKRHSGRPRRSV